MSNNIFNNISLKRIVITVVTTVFALAVLFPKYSAPIIASTFEVFEFPEDSAHTTADKGYQPLGIRTDVGTTTPHSGTIGDYAPFAIGPLNWLQTTNFAATSTVSLNNLETSYDSSNETATSTVFDTFGFRKCQFNFNLITIGTPGNATIRFFLKQRSDDDFQIVRTRYWGKFIFTDDASQVEQPVSVDFECPVAPSVIVAKCNSSCTGSLYFNIEDASINMRN